MGRDIGAALEARDGLAVLQNAVELPTGLSTRALLITGWILELDGMARPGEGDLMADQALDAPAQPGKSYGRSAMRKAAFEPPCRQSYPCRHRPSRRTC